MISVLSRLSASIHMIMLMFSKFILTILAHGMKYGFFEVNGENAHPEQVGVFRSADLDVCDDI